MFPTVFLILSSKVRRAALHALRMRHQIQPAIIDEFRERVKYCRQRVSSIKNMSVLEEGGSFYVFPNIKATGLSSNEVTKLMMEEAHVLVLPGNAFGSCGEGYIRISCTVGIEKLREAFDRIEKMKIFS